MSKERNWYVYCPENGMMYFATEEEALTAAKSFLSEHLCSIDGWSEEAGDLTMGQVTKRSTKVNERERPDSSELDEEGCDHDGICWSGTGWESICEYKMLDVQRAGRE